MQLAAQAFHGLDDLFRRGCLLVGRRTDLLGDLAQVLRGLGDLAAAARLLLGGRADLAGVAVDLDDVPLDGAQRLPDQAAQPDAVLHRPGRAFHQRDRGLRFRLDAGDQIGVDVYQFSDAAGTRGTIGGEEFNSLTAVMLFSL